MLNSIGSVSSQAYQPSLTTTKKDEMEQQIKEVVVHKTEGQAEALKRQASVTSHRAQSLDAQAEQLEHRAHDVTEQGLGLLVDISV